MIWCVLECKSGCEEDFQSIATQIHHQPAEESTKRSKEAGAMLQNDVGGPSDQCGIYHWFLKFIEYVECEPLENHIDNIWFVQ